MTANLYSILGCKPGDSHERLRKQYRLLARRWHPDMGENGNASKFADVSKAWECLGDPQRRKRYDETGVWEDSPKLRQQAAAAVATVAVAALAQNGPDKDLVKIITGHFQQVIEYNDKIAEHAATAAGRCGCRDRHASALGDMFTEAVKNAGESKEVAAAALELLASQTYTLPWEAKNIGGLLMWNYAMEGLKTI